ncbi:MAG: major capsid protein [Lachnospiraceae bacterium]|nr:major capsid protein [Lachnospiraceae bacterium]
MDIYSTRAQLAAIELMPREYSVLHDFFCHDAGLVEDDKAIYDFKKGSRKMAPMVHAGTGGVLMERDGFETREIGFCCIAPERIIEDQNLKGRIFGEKILGALSPQERERKLLAKDLMDMRKAIQRRREWMARQVLLTGKLSIFTYTNEGRNTNEKLVADYGFNNFFTPATKWNAAGAKIDDDMHTMFDLVYEGLGYVDVIVMAPDVAAAMRENSNYIKLFDGRNIDMGKLNSQYRGSGLRFIGWNSDGVEMYSLSGTFINDEGQAEALIPKGTIIAGSREVLNIYHGPVTQVEETGSTAAHKTYIKKEVPLRYGSIDGNSIKNRLTSCPTIVPSNVDAWTVATVL